MTSTFTEDIQPIIEDLDEVFKASFKRVNKEQQPKDSVAIKNLNELITIFNEIQEVINEHWNNLNDTDRELAQQAYNKYTNCLKRAFDRQRRPFNIPDKGPIPLIPTPEEEHSSSESEPEIVEMEQATFISQATKILTDFDGKPENLQRFVDALNLLNTIVGVHVAVAVSLIKTRLSGTARRLITNENTIDAIINTLQDRVKGESSQAVTAKLENLKQGNKTANAYIQEVENLTKTLEGAYIAEGIPAATASNFSTQAAVKTVAKNAANDNVKLIVQAGNFANMNELVAKFVSTATEAQSPVSILHISRQNNNRNGNFRSNFRGNHGHRFNRGRGNNNNNRRHNNNGNRGNHGNQGGNQGRNNYNNYNNNGNRNNGGQRSNNRIFHAQGGQGNGQPTNQQNRLGEDQL